MPTSVLLAVLAGAGLLALAPALVRRYDADERIAADREASTARVLDRESAQKRSGPLNPPTEAESDAQDGDSALRAETPGAETCEDKQRHGGWERRGARRAESVLLGARQEAKGRDDEQEVPVASARLRAWWQRRYRRVLYVLLALNFAELAGVVFIGPGFWLGVAVSVSLLVLFLRFLRIRARRQQRHRRPAVRVPSQSREEPVEVADEPEYDEPEYDEPQDTDIPDEPEVPVTEAPSRRRTGGIRGRSYESPANL